MIAFEFPKVKGLPSFSSDEADDWPSCLRFHGYSLLNCPKTLGIHQKFGSCLLRSKTLVSPGIFAFLANCFVLPAYPCMSMPAGAAPIEIIVLCAALVPGESSFESPESSSNPRFPRQNMWFCSGGAGFELCDSVL